MKKIATVAWAILLQNHWQLILLAAWPWVFTLMLQNAGGPPSAGDVQSVLRQECLYGLALIAILASNAYGTELRSRRAISVLGRAVSRKQYLAALWLSGVVPGLVYLASMLGSGLFAISRTSLGLATFLYMLLAVLVLMVWLGALGVLSSTVLPGFMAWVGVSVAASADFYLSGDNKYLGTGLLVRQVLSVSLLPGEAGTSVHIVSLAATLVQAAVLAILAYAIFRRKDVYSLSD